MASKPKPTSDEAQKAFLDAVAPQAEAPKKQEPKAKAAPKSAAKDKAEPKTDEAESTDEKKEREDKRPIVSATNPQKFDAGTKVRVELFKSDNSTGTADWTVPLTVPSDFEIVRRVSGNKATAVHARAIGADKTLCTLPSGTWKETGVIDSGSYIHCRWCAQRLMAIGLLTAADDQKAKDAYDKAVKEAAEKAQAEKEAKAKEKEEASKEEAAPTTSEPKASSKSAPKKPAAKPDPKPSSKPRTRSNKQAA